MTRMDDGSEGPNGTVKLIDPQVTAKAKRRRFTAEYKRRILREADAAAETVALARCCAAKGRTGSRNGQQVSRSPPIEEMHGCKWHGCQVLPH